MNRCHRCNSDYEKPGTCNCYAPLDLHRSLEITRETELLRLRQRPLSGCPVARMGSMGGMCYCTGACRGQNITGQLQQS